MSHSLKDLAIQAIKPEYRELESAKARERRAKAKLLQLAKGV